MVPLVAPVVAVGLVAVVGLVVVLMPKQIIRDVTNLGVCLQIMYNVLSNTHTAEWSL